MDLLQWLAAFPIFYVFARILTAYFREASEKERQSRVKSYCSSYFLTNAAVFAVVIFGQLFKALLKWIGAKRGPPPAQVAGDATYNALHTNPWLTAYVTWYAPSNPSAMMCSVAYSFWMHTKVSL